MCTLNLDPIDLPLEVEIWGHLCVFLLFPGGDERLPLWLCADFRGRAREGRRAEATSLLCLFSALCVQMRKRAVAEVCLCVWEGTTGRKNSVSCSHSRLYNMASFGSVVWLGACVCGWVGFSARDSQRPTSVWPAGDPADTSPRLQPGACGRLSVRGNIHGIGSVFLSLI